MGGLENGDQKTGLWKVCFGGCLSVDGGWVALILGRR